MKSNLGPDRATRLRRLGRAVYLVGILLPLLLIGGLKFTAPEIEALSPLVASTPWLSWLHSIYSVRPDLPISSESSRSPLQFC